MVLWTIGEMKGVPKVGWEAISGEGLGWFGLLTGAGWMCWKGADQAACFESLPA